jgi:hypothetical protein
MKFYKGIIASGAALLVVSLSSTVNLTSCTKELENDTITVQIHDTIIKEKVDTIIQVDTICKLDLGLVAHYNFTDGSLLDETDNHNDIVFNSATLTADKAGNADNAYLFDGSTSYMRVANSPSLNPNGKITIMARVKANDFYMGTCHFSEIVGKGYPDIIQGLYVMRIADPYGHCYDAPDVTKEYFMGAYGDDIPEGTAAGAFADTAFIQKDTWYTAIYTYDGSKAKVYVNGQLKSESEKTVTFTPNDHDLYIGRHEDPAFPYWFNGVIDEVRIYDRAISCYEVAALSADCK